MPVRPSVSCKPSERNCLCPTRPSGSCSRNKMAEKVRNAPLIPFKWAKNCHNQNTLNVMVWHLNSRFRHNIHYFRLLTYMLYQKNLDWVAVIEIFLKMAKKSYLPQKVRRLIRQRSKYMCSLYCETK